MTREKFKALLKEAGYKSKKEFAAEFGLSPQSVNNWGSSNPYPPYLEVVMTWCIKAKKYDKLIKDIQGGI